MCLDSQMIMKGTKTKGDYEAVATAWRKIEYIANQLLGKVTGVFC
jgi:hypothetical protein